MIVISRRFGEPIMRLPPFDGPLHLVTIRPEGADGRGTLPTWLAKLRTIPTALPDVSQELVMNMFRDKEGMMPLMKAGLGMGSAMSMRRGWIAKLIRPWSLASPG